MEWLRNLFKNDSGAAAIEYALLAALIVVGVIAAYEAVGNNLSSTFRTVATRL
jgi:pilus assembly protein Flp/PilA